MSDSWATLPLAECLDALIDYRGKTPTKTTSGVPLITAKLIKNGRIEPATEFIAEVGYDAWMRRGIPQPGDVVLTVQAPLGEVAQLGPGRVALAQRVVTLRGKRGLLDSDYLLYMLQSAQFQDSLRARSSGTPVVGIKQSELRQILVDVPPLRYQLWTAAVLKAIDDRIEVLRETNATLEAIAQALFKSWFVDFDPVRAKSEGRPPDGMDDATAALFPDSFEDSPLGPIPSGWTIGHRSSQLTLAKGSLNPTNEPDKEFEHFSLPAYDAEQMPAVELGRDIKSNKTIVPRNAVLLSKLNPRIPRVWLPSEVKENAICSTEFLPFVPTDKSCLEFVYCLLRSDAFMKSISQFVTGTSSSHQRIRPESIIAQDAVIAPANICIAFGRAINPVLDAIKAHRLTVSVLTNLRNELLPRLVSGQLRILDDETDDDTQ